MWPSVIPFDLFEFWVWDFSTIVQGVIAGWPIFLWGVILCTCVLLFREQVLDQNMFKGVEKAEGILVQGVFVSTIAGVFEEILFRWFIFYGCIISLEVADWFMGGFLFGNGLVYLINSWIIIPLVNLLFLWNLSWLAAMPWMVAGGAIAANAKFRIEHAYQGPIGYFNSWIGGFFLFWIMFNYGLVAAILVHFLYDMIIFGTVYVHAKIRGF